MTVDVIIPLYKPGNEIFKLLEALDQQTLPPQKIILMNTGKENFPSGILEQFEKTEVHHLTKEEFDHGATRRAGVNQSSSEVFVMMTQDALPAEEDLLAKLTAHLAGNVAAAYARQLPLEDCSPEECYSRQFNYPDRSRIKTEADITELGIKTFFCSNVCAAYRRDIYDKLGGFVERAIFNEDMIYAAGAVKNGYSIAYEAQAKVYHSHNYTNMQQLHRNFDLGVSQADHPEIFKKVPSESEGKKLVKSTVSYLRSNHMTGRVPHFMMQCCSKYIGYFLGKHYQKLPKGWILALTSNKEYWKKTEKDK